jgi:hypothetical protein
VEADFQQHYGLDLGQEVYGMAPISARRLGVLVHGLPEGSRTACALNGTWPPDRTLLGVIVERLDILTAATVRAAGGKVKEPKPFVPRPARRRGAAVGTGDALDALDQALAGGGR